MSVIQTFQFKVKQNPIYPTRKTCHKLRCKLGLPLPRHLMLQTTPGHSFFFALYTIATVVNGVLKSASVGKNN